MPPNASSTLRRTSDVFALLGEWLRAVGGQALLWMFERSPYSTLGSTDKERSLMESSGRRHFRAAALSNRFQLVLVCTLALWLLPTHISFAQWELTTPLVLDGPQVADRQAVGLADPLLPDAAMSLRAARSGTANLATVVGSGSLVGELLPAPIGYQPGMIVTVVAATPNAAAATLDLNGLGPRLILKQGAIALASGDLKPGIPARLIYDGEYFRLLSSTQLECPTGFKAVTHGYCIADQAQPAMNFFQAARNCVTQGARLCTINEWSYACRELPGFLSSVAAAEWVDHAANNGNGAKLVGAGSDGENAVQGSGCNYGGQSPPTAAFGYRCCANR